MNPAYMLPPSYPDELWLGRVARYHIRSGNCRINKTIRDLGVSSWTSCYSKKNVPVLCANWLMAKHYSYKKDLYNAIKENTLSLYFICFETEANKRLTIYQSMLGEQPARENHMLESGCLLRYCPLCTEEDKAVFGETYWHRTHQIQSLPICPKHGVALITTNEPLDNIIWEQSVPSSESCISCLHTKNRFLRLYANEIVWILKHCDDQKFINKKQEDLKKRLMDIDLHPETNVRFQYAIAKLQAAQKSVLDVLNCLSMEPCTVYNIILKLYKGESIRSEHFAFLSAYAYWMNGGGP